MASLLELLSRFRMTHRKVAIMNTFLAIAIMVSGFSLPLVIGSITMDFWDVLETLQPGDVVAWAQNCAFGTYLNKKDAYRAVINHILLERNAKLILFSFDPNAPQLNAAQMAYMKTSLEEQGKQYGVDWLIMPFLAGEESALAASAKNMRVCGVDLIEGKPLDEFPIMEGIYTLADIPVSINDAGSFTFVDMWIRQWPAAYQEFGHKGLSTYVFATVAPVYGIYVFGALDGNRGYAEYEKLTGYMGDHLQKMDMRNAQGIAIIVMVLMGNVTYFARRRLGLPPIAGVEWSQRKASREA
jgi:hypothetical protein